MAGLENRTVAVLAADGVEQVELTEPVKPLQAVLARVVVIAPKGGQIQGMNHDQKAEMLTVDHDLASVSDFCREMIKLFAAGPAQKAA